MRKLCFFIWLLFLTSTVSIATAQDFNKSDATPEPSALPEPLPGMISLYQNDQFEPSPFIDPLSSPFAGTSYQWSYYSRRWDGGPHSFSIGGGLSSRGEMMNFGEEMDLGVWQSSMTYRFYGLAGGYIRPIARFTTGIGQTADPLSGMGFSGYGTGYNAWMMSEAGVEVLFPIAGHKVGVGVTRGYIWSQDLSPDADITGGPYAPKADWQNWQDWLTQIYPIIE